MRERNKDTDDADEEASEEANYRERDDSEPAAAWTKESDHAVMHEVGPAEWGWGAEEVDGEEEAPLAASRLKDAAELDECDDDAGEFDGEAAGEDGESSGAIWPPGKPHAQPQAPAQPQGASRQVPAPAAARVRVEKGELMLKRHEAREDD
jgi:hypothetical protein